LYRRSRPKGDGHAPKQSDVGLAFLPIYFRSRQRFTFYSETMKILLAALLFTITLQCHADEILPDTFTGVWATTDSVFEGQTLLGGTALFLGKDGKGILIGGPLPVPICGSRACAITSGTKLKVSVENDRISLKVTFTTGAKNISGIGYVYHPKEKVLVTTFGGGNGDRLIRRFTGSPDKIIKELEATLTVTEPVDDPETTYYVPSHSMEPTLRKDEIVYVDTE